LSRIGISVAFGYGAGVMSGLWDTYRSKDWVRVKLVFRSEILY